LFIYTHTSNSRGGGLAGTKTRELPAAKWKQGGRKCFLAIALDSFGADECTH